jgi:hypothetical protein
MNQSFGQIRPVTTPRGSAGARRVWRDGRVFQEQAHRALAKQAVPFVQWLLLETLQELIDETGGPVSQAAVAGGTALSARVISYWMVLMAELGLIDRGPSSDGRQWRIILTSMGEQTLLACNERLEAAGLTG